jgi:5-methyltetrahydropteroyltriglutamate--homocysteine methyltransferase
MNDRILTTHVGSLVRPAELIGILESGASREAALAECLDRTVTEVVREQVANGVDIGSDGEFSKSSWAGYAMERLSGVRFRPTPGESIHSVLISKDRQDFAEFYAEYEEQRGMGGMGKGFKLAAGTSVVGEPIRYRGHAVLQADIARLKSALAATGARRGFLPVSHRAVRS